MRYETAILMILLTAAGVSAGDFKTKVELKTFCEKIGFNKSVAIGSGLKAKKTDIQRERNDVFSKQSEPKKLVEFTYQKMKHAVYWLSDFGEDEENVEFTRTAQKLHDTEPETNLIFIDDISGLNQYVAFMKEVERLKGGSPKKAKFPKAWAEEHILGNVGAKGENNSRKWYLMLGYGYKKIAELRQLIIREEDINYEKQSK